MTAATTTRALSTRTALVTGANRGIGRAITIALARGGADVAVHYNTHEDEAESACAEVRALDRRAVALQADLPDRASVAAVARRAADALGPVDILVNNAGVGTARRLDGLTEADWDLAVAVNLTAAFLLTQAVLPGMRARRWGRVINVSSSAAQIGGIVGPHYAASKAGLLGLTHSYAALAAPDGVTVNAIAPALVKTPMLGALPGGRPDRIPTGRFGRPEEVADVP